MRTTVAGRLSYTERLQSEDSSIDEARHDGGIWSDPERIRAAAALNAYWYYRRAHGPVSPKARLMASLDGPCPMCGGRKRFNRRYCSKLCRDAATGVIPLREYFRRTGGD